MKVKIWNSQDNSKNAGIKAEPGSWKTQAAQLNLKIARSGDEQNSLKNTREILLELNSLVGLRSVKRLIEEIYSYVEIQKKRQKEKLASEPLGLHMIFKGNPGTGKTTVARISGRLFKEVGVLPKGHLVEVERADLVGEFIGHTAQKTRDQVRKALGGILFIDEAYSLARGGEKDFGKEAIDALVKGMEDHRDKLILILAGYQDEMDWFIETNPGLRSRFPIHISFPDYSNDELLAIADLMLQQRQYFLSNGAREEFRFVIEKEHKRHEHSGNARLVRNLIERAIRLQAVRLLQKNCELSRDDLMVIKKEDLEGTVDLI
ncbi:MAG: AAA family ATPase [Desulfotomaculaceae bacterium]